LRLKLKTAIKEEQPKVQELMPTLTNALESHTKKVNTTTTTSTISSKLTLEIVVIMASIAIVILSCFAANAFATPSANSISDQHSQCRNEDLEKARIGEVRGAEQVIAGMHKCKEKHF
jgi:hypothetical protein